MSKSSYFSNAPPIFGGLFYINLYVKIGVKS